jgi:eukaryotic-like serine/threonine-protein kinase
MNESIGCGANEMIGTSLNHYEITGELGAGGMGKVYRARDSRLGREVAIKVLPAAFEQDRQYLSRFRREARLLASLNHPHIAAIYGFEEHNGRHFLVLELVDGETLEARLRNGPLSVPETLETARQVGEAVQAAHEKGIIHRDLKPANIKFTGRGKVKLLDFGLAKALSQAASPTEVQTVATVTGMVMGSPAYMSPEQISGEPVNEQGDIWTFGCLLYECLTGKRLFGGNTFTTCVSSVMEKEPHWEQLPKETPPALDQLLRRCLERNPRRRRPTIGEALAELENALTELRTGRTTKQQRFLRLARLGALAIAILLVLGAAGWWLWAKSTHRVP